MSNVRKCVIFGCDDAELVFLQKGDERQTGNGFLIAKVAGWYCPKCCGSYGGEQNTVPFAQADLPASKETIYDKLAFDLPEGRQVEVWRICDHDGVYLKLFNTTPTGQISELGFALHRPAAEALLVGLKIQLSPLSPSPSTAS